MLLIFRQPFRYGIASYEAIAIRGYKSQMDFSIISDSSDNSFLHVSAQTPGNAHYEKPTVTYVL